MSSPQDITPQPANIDPDDDPCARQIRLRTTAILSLLAALFAVGLIAMEAIERTAPTPQAEAESQAVCSMLVSARQRIAELETQLETPLETQALATAQARMAELEHQQTRLQQQIQQCRQRLEGTEDQLLDAQRQCAALPEVEAEAEIQAAKTVDGVDCGEQLAALGALGLKTRLTAAGLRIELSSAELRFPSGSATLPNTASLQALADWLSRYPDLSVRVLGYTDSSGDAQANQALSQARAMAVREALIALGAGEAQLEAEGRGEREPMADNATAEGRELNRRVELLVAFPSATD